jgi:hypothetical protein
MTMSADPRRVQGFLHGHGCDALSAINQDNGIDPLEGSGVRA